MPMERFELFQLRKSEREGRGEFLMNRRKVLAGGLSGAAGLLLKAALPSMAMGDANARPGPLKSAVGAAGPQIGIASLKSWLEEPAFAQLVVKNFNLLAPSGMKWDRIHPGADTYSFEEADWVVNFATQHQMLVHGHNLCWNAPESNPAWLKQVLTKQNAKEYLVSHITTVMKRYEGRIDSWDVVNEPIVSWPGRSDGLYPGIWVDLLGPEYLDIAFHTAATTDPKALRVLNVHHVEQDIPDNDVTRTRVLGWLKRMVSRGVPVQAVGLESHLDASQPLLGKSFVQFVEGIKALGLEVLVTELDVKETRAEGTSLDWDKKVAQYYGDYLTEVLSAVTPRAVIFWSLKDRWERGKKIQGLFQDSLSPRMSYSAATKALMHQWSGS
jgi:endo-1,4-beta-xylanase